jgi:hypothetical protein
MVPPMGRDRPAQEPRHRRGAVRDVELLRPLPAGVGQPLPQVPVTDQPIERRGQLGLVAPVHQ